MSQSRGYILQLVALSTLSLWGCDDDAESSIETPVDAQVSADMDVDGDASAEDATVAVDQMAPDAATEGCTDGPCIEISDCDPLMPDVCAMPWPSNLYLKADDSRDTGYALTFGPTTLPATHLGVHIDPTPYGRMDGFGVGGNMIVLFPNVDPTRLPNELQIEASMAPDAQILVYEATDAGLERVPYFVDVDLRESDLPQRALIIKPAVLLKENTRYLVAIRDLEDRDGNPIAPSRAFAALQDGTAAEHPALAPRVPTFEAIFTDLTSVGVARDSLILAWDFHTASHKALHGDLLHMRDEALETVGAAGPELTFTEIVERTVEEDPNIAFEIQGTARVPHYMQISGPYQQMTGWVINRDEAGTPVQDGWRDMPFWLRIPRVALEGEPMSLLEYGHGLNGTGAQAKSDHLAEFAQREGIIVFSANMIGMSSEDVPGIVSMLTDLSWFPWLADRLHQGLLDYVLIARAMKGGLAQMPWIQEQGIQIDGDALYYTGDSQGGIYGATYMAISTDTIRGLLGVPGQNYSTLLTRSVDFNPFLLVLDGVYPDKAEQAVVLSTLQVLWDRTDPVSHWRHMSAEPHENTPAHQVIAATAKGDYQVPLVTMEIVARSDVGLHLMDNYDNDRTVPLVEPTAYPVEGSALVNWHFGNPWPAIGNVPPDDDVGDPHNKPRKSRALQDQMMHHFRTGEVIDTCIGGLCPPSE